MTLNSSLQINWSLHATICVPKGLIALGSLSAKDKKHVEDKFHRSLVTSVRTSVCVFLIACLVSSRYVSKIQIQFPCLSTHNITCQLNWISFEESLRTNVKGTKLLLYILQQDFDTHLKYTLFLKGHCVYAGVLQLDVPVLWNHSPRPSDSHCALLLVTWLPIRSLIFTDRCFCLLRLRHYFTEQFPVEL